MGCKPPAPKVVEGGPSSSAPALDTWKAPTQARVPGAVVYEVFFEQRAQRRLRVRATYPTEGRETVTLVMPVWIPGSYLIREFSRNVIFPSGFDLEGRSLSLEKTAKNRFRVSVGKEVKSVVFEYLVYANTLTVRGSYVDADYGVINPAATFFYDEARAAKVHELVLHLPESWTGAEAALDRLSLGGAAVAFSAPSFEALVDAPLVVGQPVMDRFEVNGVAHGLVHIGRVATFPRAKAREAVELVAKAQARFWGNIPYASYLFLNVLDHAGGGLEHLNSTLVMYPPERAFTVTGWRRWLSLISHELFHAWNGKRLRPVALGPFDLEREAYTQSLWFVEGLTSYYDDLLLKRAGLHSDESYLLALSQNAEKLRDNPGQTRQSLARSSYDAWIEFYRRDPASNNTAVSYYTKGALVGWVLDAEIRRRSDGRASLDDVMRAAYRAYSGETGYADHEVFEVLERVAGPAVRALAERLVRSPEVLDLTPALEAFGLRFREVDDALPEDFIARREALGKRSYLGAKWRREEGRILVEEVFRGGPAWTAGLAPEDELIALDQDRVPPDGPSQLLSRHAPGDSVPVLVSRRGRILELKARLQAVPRPLVIEIDPKASTTAERLRRAWLNGN